MKFAIIASGPSLTAEDCERVRRFRTIVVNTSYRLAPWADYLYACDYWWWANNLADVRERFHGELWTQDRKAANAYRLNYVESRRLPGLGRDCIHQGGNSGYQAVNLAYLWGARTIVLLGFDMSPDGKRTHWHEPHSSLVSSPYETWVERFGVLADDLRNEGVRVLNASRRTALTCFERVDASALPAE